ncbi:Mannose-specific lectin [Apostasia shenzhenica]|uniref:Mannose-specific lectin n=1 Tax=Apostasia shenzhenica TaxID=1088818 RepID=A0A2I0BCH7_9ASPA|nr:Mannose-specific lectin [Apostasia shenzhenica]
MTHNRNAIVYGSPIWSAAADSGDGCGANGILADPTPAVSTPAADNNHLLFGETLGPGESLKLGNLSLVMEKTCNLVLYDSGRSSKPRRLWATHTRRKGRECRLGIEDGGNLVVLDGRRNRTVWESGCRSAAGGRNFALVLLLDRTVALYSRSWWSAVA